MILTNESIYLYDGREREKRKEIAARKTLALRAKHFIYSS
jgi:hypothetical protein